MSLSSPGALYAWSRRGARRVSRSLCGPRTGSANRLSVCVSTRPQSPPAAARPSASRGTSRAPAAEKEESLTKKPRRDAHSATFATPPEEGCEIEVEFRVDADYSRVAWYPGRVVRRAGAPRAPLKCRAKKTIQGKRDPPFLEGVASSGRRRRRRVRCRVWRRLEVRPRAAALRAHQGRAGMRGTSLREQFQQGRAARPPRSAL